MLMAFKYLRDCCAKKGRDSFVVAGVKGRGGLKFIVGRRLLPMSTTLHGLGLPKEGVSPLSLEVCKYQ